MSKQIMLQDITWQKLDLIRKQTGRNYSMNTIVNRLIDEYYDFHDTKQITDFMRNTYIKKVVRDAQVMGILDKVPPEFEILLRLVFSQSYKVIPGYIKGYFGAYLKKQKQKVLE